MTWVVKSIGHNGKISQTIMDHFEKAFELRQEILSKGIMAWIEDSNGRLVGFTVIKDATQGVEIRADATGVMA